MIQCPEIKKAQMNRLTDGRTDKAGYRVAGGRLTGCAINLVKTL